jgi:hypothetical protein
MGNEDVETTVDRLQESLEILGPQRATCCCRSVHHTRRESEVEPRRKDAACGIGLHEERAAVVHLQASGQRKCGRCCAR